MARLDQAVLNTGYATGHSPMLDLRYGGQNSYSPNLAEWVSNQNYVRRNLVCLLIEAPRGFDFMDDPQAYRGALKAMVEVHAKNIEGFNAGLTVDAQETAVSGAGEMQQDPTNVTRTRTEPTFAFTDKYGRPIQSFLHDWITMLIMDPDSKVPGISTLPAVRPGDLLADMYGATMLFFEPDPTHTLVSKAWLTTNMYPMSTGDIIGKRDLTSAGEVSELSIKFSGVSQTGNGVRAFAQTLLDKVNLTNANPYLRPAYMNDIDVNVKAADIAGYKENIDGLTSTAVLRS
jgi:hypothetical protein